MYEFLYIIHINTTTGLFKFITYTLSYILYTPENKITKFQNNNCKKSKELKIINKKIQFTVA